MSLSFLSYKSKATRKEFNLSFLFITLTFVIFSVAVLFLEMASIAPYFGIDLPYFGDTIVYIIYAMMIFSVLATIYSSILIMRRLNDLNKPRYQILFTMIPIYGLVFMFILMTKKGDSN